ncbi:hypothetical protein A6R68_06512, partial [Neotoma lepida]
APDLGSLHARCCPPLLHSSHDHPRPPAPCLPLAPSPAATIQSTCWYSHGSLGTECSSAHLHTWSYPYPSSGPLYLSSEPAVHLSIPEWRTSL